MKVYIAFVDENVHIDEEKLRFLSAERCEKIKQFRFDEDKRISFVSGMIIRHFAVKEKMIVSGAVKLAYGKYGKPYYPNYPKYHFSVSHTKKCVVYTNSDVPVGIDVEDNSRADETLNSIAKASFTHDEFNAIMKSSDSASEFLRIWTAKEAFLKCTGEGLTRPLDSFSVFDLPHGYELSQVVYKDNFITVCCNGKCDDIVIEELPIERLIGPEE